MPITEIQKTAIAANIPPEDQKRIAARIVLQEWGGRKNDDAIFVAEKTLDVTDTILLLDYDLIAELRDGSDQTDEIGLAHLHHHGPLEVYVTDSICEFFAVESVKDITAEAFEEARRIYKPKSPEYIRTVIEVEFTAKVLPGANLNAALDDLTVAIVSQTDNIIVTGAKRRAPQPESSQRAEASAPALPRFMQMLAVANGVTLDDGAMLTHWETSEWQGIPTNEVVRFAWTDGRFNYREVLTEEGVEEGSFDDNGAFSALNQEGDLCKVKLFFLQQIVPVRSLSIH